MKARALTMKEIGHVRRALAPLVEAHPSKAALARTLGMAAFIERTRETMGHAADEGSR